MAGLRRDATRIFLGLWLLYGAGINALNLQAYTLHPVVVKALAEEGTFVIGHEAAPKENDRFLYEGNLLPAKQPLIFALGAAVYTPCRWLGLTYENYFHLAGAVVTWLTASLLAAAGAVAAFVLAVRVWRFPRGPALAAVLAWAIGSNLLPYAGIPHHDVAATAMLVMALLALESARREPAGSGEAQPSQRTRAAVAGLCLGLTLGFSMLPAAIVAGILVAVAATRKTSIVLPAGLGFLAGLLPLVSYNLYYFRNPFLQANLAGPYEETYPGFVPARFVHNLNAYLGSGEVSLWKYAPIVLAGAVGVVWLAARRREPGPLLGALLLLHGAYVLSIPAIGACQYGPRYLMPAIPLAALGLAPLLDALRRTPARAVRLGGLTLVAAAGLASFAVNLVGTIGGTMYCAIEQFAFPRYLAVLGSNASWQMLSVQFPLAAVCLPGLALFAIVTLGRGLRATAIRPSLDRPATRR